MEKFSKIVDHVILNQISSTQCKICKVKLTNPSVQEGHYNSKKHSKNVIAYREEAIEMMVSNENTVSSNGSSKFSVPLIYAKPEVAKIFNCGICKIELNSKLWKESHVKEFPHADLLKLKRESLKQGYKDDLYSIHEGKFIYCHICNAVLQCTGSVKSHCKSAKHQTKFNNLDTPVYEVQDIPDYLCKWIFCKICNKNLDGTSDSDSHYAAFDQTSYTPVNVNTSAISDFSGTSTQTNQLPINNETDANIQKQIFIEVEKLVETLYYSNKVPLAESLRYLKELNSKLYTVVEEVDTLEGTISDEDEASVVSRLSTWEIEEHSDVASEIDEAIDDAPNYTIVGTVAQKTTDKTDEAPEIEADTREETLLDERPGEELGIIQNKPKTIDDVRKQIFQEMKKQEENGCTEKVEVLDEIDSLLYFLVAGEGHNWPWQEILDCLKAFNETVEKETGEFEHLMSSM